MVLRFVEPVNVLLVDLIEFPELLVFVLQLGDPVL